MWRREQSRGAGFLQRPAAVDEALGQPVEQFRVGRRLAKRTEVVRRANDRLAKVMLPNAVDHHTSGERIFRISDPLGQLKSTGLLGSFADRLRMGRLP